MIEPIEPNEHSYLKSMNAKTILKLNPLRQLKSSELEHLEQLNNFQKDSHICLIFPREVKKARREEIKIAMKNSVSGKKCPRKYGNFTLYKTVNLC